MEQHRHSEKNCFAVYNLSTLLSQTTFWRKKNHFLSLTKTLAWSWAQWVSLKNNTSNQIMLHKQLVHISNCWQWLGVIRLFQKQTASHHSHHTSPSLTALGLWWNQTHKVCEKNKKQTHSPAETAVQRQTVAHWVKN